jgi:hypothetical protein
MAGACIVLCFLQHQPLSPLCLIQAGDHFRSNEHAILVATDVAARGLDIPGVRTVVHYQLPHSTEVKIGMLFLKKKGGCFNLHF